jgi:hypothetical protein
VGVSDNFCLGLSGVEEIIDKWISDSEKTVFWQCVKANTCYDGEVSRGFLHLLQAKRPDGNSG